MIARPHFGAMPRSSPDLHRILKAIHLAEAHVARCDYRGYDPYDALRAPLFSLPGLRANRPVRLAAQQIVRRLPINVRPLLRIPRGRNPVTLGLMIQGYSYLSALEPDRAGLYRSRLDECLEELGRLRSPGFSGACWGYDFDWEGRYTTLPAFSPTVVATGFITNGLFTAYELTGAEAALDFCVSASDFVLNDLNRTPGPDGSFCWSYSPFDRQVVLNATVKGARLCAQVFSVTGQDHLLEAATRSNEFVVQHQAAAGAWPYSARDTRTWSDSFHTGYVIDGLLEFERRTGSDRFRSAAELGWRYYRERMFEGYIPRYSDEKRYPIDATACAQAIITLSKFGDPDGALRLATWTIDRMQKSDGAFAYRVHRAFVNRIPYMRWSTACMICALGTLLYGVGLEREKRPPPVQG